MSALCNNRYEIGKRIAQARINKGKEWTQEYLSEIMDVQRPTISAWETGSRIPSHESIQKLCEILGVDYGYIFYSYDEKDFPTHKVCEVTGLSEQAVNTIENLNTSQKDILNQILENDLFIKVLNNIKYRNSAESVVTYTINKGNLLTPEGMEGNPTAVAPWDSFEDFKNSIDFQITKIFNQIIDSIE